jgi:Zn-dependent peptidase ImmA (M78 family)
MTDDTKSFDFWISRLASDYKVSRQVILRRAHDLGAVGPRVYKEKYSEYNIDYSDIVKKKEIQKQKRKEAGVSGGGESVSSKVVRNYGPTYTKTVIDALNTSRITNYQAAEYLGRIKTMHLGGIEEVFSKRYG